MAEKRNLDFEDRETNSLIEPEEINDETNSETEQIREKIEETRQEMSETIDAIQEKLSIANISEQVTEHVTEKISDVYQTAKETVYQATLGKAGKIMKSANNELQKSNLYQKVLSNPVPLFFMALGAGLIIFRNKNGRGHYSENKKRNLSETKYPNEKDSAMNKLNETVSSAYQSVSERAESAYQTVSGAADKTYQKIGDLSGSAQEKYEYYLEENPLAVGAVALAVGASIGMLIPTTKYEEDLVGEMSRNLLNKAQTKTRETVDSIKSVAGQAVENIREEAKSYQA